MVMSNKKMVQQKNNTKNNLPPIKQLDEYKMQLQNELAALLEFWIQNTPDGEFGGFYGKLDNFNKVEPYAPKGAVLNSRILWSFSAAYNLDGNKEYLKIAERAYHYIADHFIDK